jgi:exopolyphosphatase/guanosine-5'-triphosphate,3'-diphosphate pyrophosphatase
MRLGVLDVGSNTIHLLVVDAHHGAAPSPQFSQKFELKLAESLEASGHIKAEAIDRLVETIEKCKAEAHRLECDEFLAFATSAIREAGNGNEVLARVRNDTEVELEVLDGEHEGILTFLAVRRWYGWSSGRLLVADIGGGSLEIAQGVSENPEHAISLPLGSGRLTRQFFTTDPPSEDEISQLRKYVREQLKSQIAPIIKAGQPDHVVATSKTFKQLARITGAAPSSKGPRARRELAAADLFSWIGKLSTMSAKERAKLPGVSEGRAEQLLAGAIVAQETMDLMSIRAFEICPWALREGIILRRLDWIEDEE